MGKRTHDLYWKMVGFEVPRTMPEKGAEVRQLIDETFQFVYKNGGAKIFQASPRWEDFKRVWKQVMKA